MKKQTISEKEVVIDVLSLHALDEPEEDRLEFSTDGMYRYENGRAQLWYFESEVTGLAGTRTSVEIRPEGVVVDRSGTVTSRMEFREGLKNFFPYETPYGMATMGMSTRKICAAFDEHGGSMELDYVLDLEHAAAVRNKICLKVRENQAQERGDA